MHLKIFILGMKLFQVYNIKMLYFNHTFLFILKKFLKNKKNKYQNV